VNASKKQLCEVKLSSKPKESNKMKSSFFLAIPLAVLLAMTTGCDKKLIDVDRQLPDSPDKMADPAPPPEPIVTVGTPSGNLEFWPWTSPDFSTPLDPVNLVFIGEVDPLAMRAALMFLDGDRTAFGFPDEYPFNATWRDALGGGVQVTYGVPEGWEGSVIQLECGDYDPIRFHLRLFDTGDWTLGGVHLEVLIPGTQEHQVISWELAEQLVMVDFLRSGLLDPDVPLFTTDQINDSPWREIPAVIYNGLPVELRMAIGGPIDDQTDPVPIGTDGCATVLNIAQDFGWEPDVARQSLTLNFDQVIPKPFCGDETFEYIYVQGPIDLDQVVRILPNGNLVSRFQARGRLEITPVDPTTDPPTPLGETYSAIVRQNDRGIITDSQTLVSSFTLQIEIPPSGPFHGRLLSALQVGPNGQNSYSMEVECGG
jgi:hypothetical protein